jgi:hypothetical protein
VGDALPRARRPGQDRREVLVRVALVQEHRLAELAREGELRGEGLALHVRGREVPVVVEAALAHRDHLGRTGELPKLGERLAPELTGVVRMHAGGREQAPRMGTCECNGAARARECRARHDELDDAGRRGTREYGVPIGVVTVVREIDADVDERGGRACPRGCAKVGHVTAILLNGAPVLRRPHADAVPRRARPSSLLVLAAATLAALAGAAWADEAQWRDLESRIQYGYYTEDRRALQNLADNLALDESHGEWRAYYAGLVNWRLAQLTAQAPPGGKGPSVSDLAQRCTRALDAALESHEDFVEGLALRSACLATPLAGGGMHLPGHRPRKDVQRALSLAPRNPRALLIDALSDYELPPSLGGNQERALGEFRRAVAAFETERAGPEVMPGWGAAEAYMLLGQNLLAHNDPVGARDALERALLLAPDYAQARRLMAKIISG